VRRSDQSLPRSGDERGEGEAIERFGLARLTALFFVFSGAVIVRHGVSSLSTERVLFALFCFTAAAVFVFRTRAHLVDVLANIAYGRGMDPEAARPYAWKVVARIGDPVRPPPSTSPIGSIPREDPMSLPQITITKPDFDRLGALFASVGPANDGWVERLDEELARANVVPADSVPPDVVTMNSRVCFEDENAGVTREITLVYPSDADAESSRVSVFAPIGSALLGLRVGQSIDWPLPNGRRKRYRVVSIPYQPEASGHYDL
jgi:regulator of nucleoside diphosphate kinase